MFEKLLTAGMKVLGLSTIVFLAYGMISATKLPVHSSGSEIGASIVPATPLIEMTKFGQALNFDFNLTNEGDQPLELTEIRLVVRDSQGAVALRRTINDNGVSPGIETVPRRRILPGNTITVFNPFHTFPADLPLARLDFEFAFATEPGTVVRHEVSVTPRTYRPRTQLRLPLDGRVLVHSGHDFYTHHRRLDFNDPPIQDLGISTNSSRYAFDFVIVDEDGEMRFGPGEESQAFRSFGHPVVSPAAGTVVAVVDDIPERGLGWEEIRENPAIMFGNYVVIDHENGEYSQMGHFIEGSISVRVGDRVSQGQVIARIGNTGSSLWPHLHYGLVSGPDIWSEGVPAYFEDLDRILGTTRVPGDGARIESGEIVEARRK